MAALKALRAAPSGIASLPAPALAAWAGFRPAHARRLQALFAATPFPHLDVGTYYRRRFDLLRRCLELHGRPLRPDEVRAEGVDIYRAALQGNRPVTLVGLHSGAVELLHRFPPAPPDRPFRVLTAPAFSAPLTDYMRKGRERDGKKILMNDSMAGLREVLDRKGVLAVMADQHPGAPQDFLSLWGRVAVPWPARLLRFLEARGTVFVPVSTRLMTDGTHAFRFHPAWDDAPAARVRAFLEEAIAAAPDQYNWSYPKITAHRA